MPVNTPSAAYDARLESWLRCRDCYEGGDAVKARGETYLPMLDSHSAGSGSYDAYKHRALFFNATARTVDGLAGAVHQKAPVVTSLPTIEALAADINLAGKSLESAALETTGEQLKVGRLGIFVDWSVAARRPYWVMYDAEQIVSWRAERLGGDEVTTRVVLREQVKESNPDDPFVDLCVEQYRVLQLGSDGYTQTVWRERLGPDGKGTGEWAPYAQPERNGQPAIPATIRPERRGQPLPGIPFVFVGTTGMQAEPEKPPLLDLVDVNLSHYRNSADLEHGLHFVGVPQLVITGQAATDDVKFGSGNALFLPTAGADAKILQANGDLMGALERADERKRKLMATLGARLLEEPSGVAETLGAVGMRHAGEHATLRTIAQVGEQALTMAWRWTAWWMGIEAKPDSIQVGVEFNKEFFSMKATPEEARAALQLWMDGAISQATLYERLQKGGWAREGVTLEDEQAQVEVERATKEAASQAAGNERARIALEKAAAGAAA